MSRPRVEAPKRPLLPWGEQTLIAAAIAVAVLAIGASWGVRALRHDRRIDLAEAPQREVEFVVDLNTARWPELVQLPQVGETTARAIVAERDRGGPYSSLNEVAERVYGIGPLTLKKIEPYVRQTWTSSKAETTAEPS